MFEVNTIGIITDVILIYSPKSSLPKNNLPKESGTHSPITVVQIPIKKAILITSLILLFRYFKYSMSKFPKTNAKG